MQQQHQQQKTASAPSAALPKGVTVDIHDDDRRDVFIDGEFVGYTSDDDDTGNWDAQCYIGSDLWNSLTGYGEDANYFSSPEAAVLAIVKRMRKNKGAK